jgi:exosortase
VVLLVPLALLWLILINELRVEWSTNPQYAYGWVVPLLCVGLLFRRIAAEKSTQRTTKADSGKLTAEGMTTKSESREPRAEIASNFSSQFSAVCFGGYVFQLSAFCFLLFLVLPLRLILEANPAWPIVNWLLALDVVAVTLLLVYWPRGRHWTLQLAFPVCFILVAVPWLKSIEIPLIQGLTRANVAATIEVLGFLGIPSAQHGNVIEVSAGMVGIDEACSGIRSFQSSIMISLFLGEFFRLALGRRLLLFGLGFVLSFLFNLCRTTLLTHIAARQGVDAISRYHDPAGLTILLACTAALWAVAAVLKSRKRTADSRKQTSEIAQTKAEKPTAETLKSDLRPPTSGRHFRFPLSAFRFSGAFLVWLLVVEGTVEAWYRSHESRSAGTPEWTLKWPPTEPGFRETEVPKVSREMLGYDEGHTGSWRSADNLDWALYYFRWYPGKMALVGARSHSPEICLAAAGKTVKPIEDDHVPMTVHSLVFPFRRYEFEEAGRTVQVFRCLWEEQAAGKYFTYDPKASLLSDHLRAVWQGQRNLGQRSIEILVAGLDDPALAQEEVRKELEKMIEVGPQTLKADSGQQKAEIGTTNSQLPTADTRN